MISKKKTKIIATIGPSSENEKILEKIPIAEIEKFLRKNKLENLKNKEE